MVMLVIWMNAHCVSKLLPLYTRIVFTVIINIININIEHVRRKRVNVMWFRGRLLNIYGLR